MQLLDTWSFDANELDQDELCECACIVFECALQLDGLEGVVEMSECSLQRGASFLDADADHLCLGGLRSDARPPHLVAVRIPFSQRLPQLCARSRCTASVLLLLDNPRYGTPAHHAHQPIVPGPLDPRCASIGGRLHRRPHATNGRPCASGSSHWARCRSSRSIQRLHGQCPDARRPSLQRQVRPRELPFRHTCTHAQAAWSWPPPRVR